MKLDRLCKPRRNFSIWLVFDIRRFVKYLKYALCPRKSLVKNGIGASQVSKRLVHKEHGGHKGHEFAGRAPTRDDARPAVPYHRSNPKGREQLHHRRHETSDSAGSQGFFVYPEILPSESLNFIVFHPERFDDSVALNALL